MAQNCCTHSSAACQNNPSSLKCSMCCLRSCCMWLVITFDTHTPTYTCLSSCHAVSSSLSYRIAYLPHSLLESMITMHGIPSGSISSMSIRAMHSACALLISSLPICPSSSIPLIMCRMRFMFSALSCSCTVPATNCSKDMLGG